MAIKTKDQDPTEFEIATKEFAEVQRRFAALIRKVESMELAMAVTSVATAPFKKPAPLDVVMSKIDPADIRLVERWPDRAVEQLQETKIALEELQPAYHAARERLDLERRRETSRIAKELQPKQRAAVQKIARALETLSAALADERAVRQELKLRAPEPVSGYLPDASYELAFADLSAWSSPASAWAKRMRTLGAL